MILDLSSVINFEGKKLNFNKEIDFSQNKDVDFCFDGPIKVSGEVLNIGGSLELTMSVSAVVIFSCDRCLETFSEEISFSFKEVLKKEDIRTEDQNPDAVYFEGSSVELDDIVLNNIIVELPLKRLCREDCKGLCQVCGQNQNIKECNCEKEVTDPRYDVLDKFFE